MMPLPAGQVNEKVKPRQNDPAGPARLRTTGPRTARGDPA